MEFHGITMKGPITVLKETLPAWTSDYEGRIIYVKSDGAFYYGTDSAWISNFTFKNITVSDGTLTADVIDDTLTLEGVGGITITKKDVNTITFTVEEYTLQKVTTADGDVVPANNAITLTEGTNISISVSGSEITISVPTATTSVEGVASFNTNNFTVTDGAVTLKSINHSDLVGAGTRSHAWIDDWFDNYSTPIPTIDHNNLLNKGTHTHNEIDTFIDEYVAIDNVPIHNAKSTEVHGLTSVQKITGTSTVPADSPVIDYIPQWKEVSPPVLKQGLAVVTTVRETGIASDLAVPTEQAVRELYTNQIQPTLQYIHIQHKESTGVWTGGNILDDWCHQTLNTLIYSNITGASLGTGTWANYVILPAGTYTVKATSPHLGHRGSHRCRVYNHTHYFNPNNTPVYYYEGTLEGQGNTCTDSKLDWKFTIDRTCYITLEHYYYDYDYETYSPYFSYDYSWHRYSSWEYSHHSHWSYHITHDAVTIYEEIIFTKINV